MRPHLSPSQIGTYEKCPKAWEWRYVHGIKSPPGVAALLGKSVHGSIEMNLKAKMAGKVVSVDAAKQAAADLVAANWLEEAPALDPDDGNEKQQQDATVDDAVKLAELHHADVAPAILPVAVERKVTLEMPGPHDLVVVMDCEEEKRIRDTKTTAKAPNADAAVKSTQLSAYAYVRRVEGKPVDFVQLDHLVRTKRPKHVAQEATRDAVDDARFVARFNAVSAAVLTGVFPPTSPDSWACSEKWCGYWNRCEFGSRQAVSVQAPAVDW